VKINAILCLQSLSTARQNGVAIFPENDEYMEVETKVKTQISMKHQSFMVAFWSFFTGLQVERGLDRLRAPYAKSEWMIPFALALICGFGVALCLRRMIGDPRPN
jgi:hypothetical protein